MKKWTRLLISLLILSLLLSACGGESEEEVSGSITPATEAATEAAVATEAATEAAAEAAMEASEEAAQATGEVPDTPVSMGRMEGGTYTNEYIGFAIDLDSTWTYYSAEELQELPDNVAELFEGTEVGESIDTMNQFTDMMAESVEELASINVLYQKMAMSERLLYATMDNEAILDSVLEQNDMMISSYAAAGIDVQSMEKVTISFCGQDRPALKTMAITQGVEYYTLQIFEFHLGQYSVTTTFSSFVEDKTEALAAMCYAVQ